MLRQTWRGTSGPLSDTFCTRARHLSFFFKSRTRDWPDFPFGVLTLTTQMIDRTPGSSNKLKTLRPTGLCVVRKTMGSLSLTPPEIVASAKKGSIFGYTSPLKVSTTFFWIALRNGPCEIARTLANAFVRRKLIQLDWTMRCDSDNCACTVF